MIWLKLLKNVRSQGFLRLASVLMVACIGALIIRVGYVELEFTHFLSAEVRLTPTNKG